MSFAGSQRTQEPGVRMAPGADERRLLRMVPGQGSVPAGCGVVLVAIVVLAASIVPAWRATRVDPMTTLRAE